MRNLHLLYTSVLLASLSFPAQAQNFGPEAKREFTAKRKNVFEFTQKPTVRQDGDKATIRFAVKDYCDVTVVVEDNSGRIKRHLASGVLGANAPDPFQKNTLSQTIIWDGKDDLGKYIDEKGALKIRVSLGLKAKYEKDLYHHPKRQLGIFQNIAIDKHGVYIHENNMVDFVKMYDHDARYVRTIHPFPADKLDKVKGLKTHAWPPNGKRLPAKEGFYNSTLLPIFQGLYDADTAAGDMAAQNGHIALLGKPRLARLKNDGSTGGMELVGPETSIKAPKGMAKAGSIAISPDGKWIYMARIFAEAKAFRGYTRSYPVDGIYRMSYRGVQPPKLFIGSGTSKDFHNKSRRAVNKPTGETHFHFASSVDTDSRGRIYVSDYEHNRIQIFSAEAKFLKSIPVIGPSQVMVHKKTGTIYVATWPMVRRATNNLNRRDKAFVAYCNKYNEARRPMLRSFQSFDKPVLKMEAPIPLELVGLTPKVALDSWSKEPTIWVRQVLASKLKVGRSGFQVFALKDGRLFLKTSFDKECEKAGVRQMVPSFQRQYLFFDPLRKQLYVGEPDSGKAKIFKRVVRIDVATGRSRVISLPGGAADMGFDATGMAYLRIGSSICRFNPENWSEVRYDYGEERGVSSDPGTQSYKAVSAVMTPGGGGGSARYGAFGVSAAGEAIVACSYKMPRSGQAGSRGKEEETEIKKTARWKPQYYPGRPGGMFIHVIDRYGKIKHEDIMKGIGLATGGLDMDLQGNVYGAVRASRILDGKKYPFGHTGVVLKFNPEAGRFITNHKPMVELEAAPAGKQPIAGRWVNDADWLYGGTSVGGTHHCWCRQGRFKTDYLGRSFVPEYARYSVAVLDTNGNLILRVGQYGNVDSAGPKSQVPLPGDGIGLMDAHYVTTHTDKRLFIADVGNGRIVSAMLGYHVTERLKLKD